LKAVVQDRFGPPDVLELLEAGTVTPVVERIYPLSEAADAFRHLGEGHARGKLVVVV
jgi:NADPH:quinone reductase-like Zn-dependent oxidoreductase